MSHRRSLILTVGLLVALALASWLGLGVEIDTRTTVRVTTTKAPPAPPAPPAPIEPIAQPRTPLGTPPLIVPVVQDDRQAEPLRFAVVDVFIDTGNAPLAAYQFELRDKAGVVKVVGLESDKTLPFQNPPLYDARAMQSRRVVVGGYSADDNARLPTGKVHVATVHVTIEGDAEPQYGLKLIAAARGDGEKIDAKLSYTHGSAP